MYLYHYSTVPYAELLTRSMQGLPHVEWDDIWVKLFDMRYNDTMSFFMEPIPLRTISKSFTEGHPFWKDGGVIFEHRVKIDDLGDVQFAVAESDMRKLLRKVPETKYDDAVIAAFKKGWKLLGETGDTNAGIHKAVRRFKGTTERAYDKLRTSSTKYAPNVPHLLVKPSKPVGPESTMPVMIGTHRPVGLHDGPMYHLSFNPNLPKILKPRFPAGSQEDGTTTGAYPEDLPPRISASPTIEQCFYAIYPNIMDLIKDANGRKMTIHAYTLEPTNKSDVIDNATLVRDRKVWDAHVTGEVCYTGTVRARNLGKIYIDPDKDLGEMITSHAFNDPEEDLERIAPRLLSFTSDVLEPSLESAKAVLEWDATFGPSYTPMEMLDLGIFEGIYTHAIKGIPAKYKKHPKVVGRNAPDVSINKYGVKSRQSLKVWQEKGWTTEHSMLGWWEWYVKYFEGRRLEKEDAWQIKRWNSFVARHMGQIAAAGVLFNERKHVAQRQGLLQWAWDSTTAHTPQQVKSNAIRVAKLAGCKLTTTKPGYL